MSEAVSASSKSSKALPQSPFVRFQRILFAFGALSVAGVIFLALLPLFIDGESFREPLQKALSAATHREMVLGKVEVRTFGGVGLKTDQLRVVRPDGTLELEARGIFVELDLLSLITRNLAVKTIELDGAQLTLVRNRQGVWNFADLLSGIQVPTGQVAVDLSHAGLRLFDSSVSIADEGSQPPQTFQVTGLSLNLSRFDRAAQPVSLQGTILNSLGKRLAVLTVDGELALPEDGNWQKLGGNVRILAEKFRPRFLSAYTGSIPSLRGLAGVYDLDFNWKGRIDGESHVEGSLVTRLLNWTWPEVLGKAPWVARGVKLQGALGISNTAFVAEQLQITGEGFDVQIKGTATRPTEGGTQPNLDLSVATGFIDPYAVRPVLPTALIPEDVRPWVYESKGSGQLRSDVRLRGPLDQPQVEGTVEFQNFSLANSRLRLPIAGLNGRALLTDKLIEFQALRIGPPGFELGVEGTVGREKDPVLNLKLAGDSADLSVFSLVVGERVGNLGGHGRVDLTLAGTLNLPQALGRVEFQDATLQREGWPQPLRAMRGTLAFEPQKLTLADLSLGVGSSTASINGFVEGYGTAQQNPQLSITSPALDLQAARYVLSSELFEGPLRRVVRHFTSLAGTAGVDLKVQGDQVTGKVDLRGADLGIEALGVPLENSEGTLIFADGAISFEQLRTVVAGSSLLLKGAVGRYGDILRLSGDGTLNFPRATALLAPAGRIEASGSVPVSFTITGEGEGRSLQATADLSGLSEFTVGGLVRLAPARRLVLGGVLTSDTLLVRDSRLELSDFDLAVSGSVNNPLRRRQRYNLQLSTDGAIDLAILGQRVAPLADLGIGGGAPSPLSLRVVGSTPLIQGSLALRGVALPSVLGGISDLDGPLNFEGGRLSSPGLDFKMNGGITGRVSGALDNPQNPSLNFDLHLDRLNLDGLLASGEGDLKNLRGQGRLRIDSGILSRLNFENLTAQARLDRGIWNLSSLDVAIAGGKMSGSVGVNLRPEAPLYNGDIALRGVDANLIAATYLNFASQISGSGDLSLNFTAQGGTAESFLGSMSGSGSLLIEDGRIWTQDLIGPLFGGGLSGTVRGLGTGRFDRLGGPFRLSGGTATLDNLVYVHPNVQLSLEGTLNLLDRSASLRGQGEFLRPSTTLEALLRRAGSEANRFAFTLEGPLTQSASLRDLRWVEAPVQTPEEPAAVSVPALKAQPPR